MKPQIFRSRFPLTLIIVVTALIGSSAAWAELTVAELTTWLDAYGDAWESRDADSAASLFSEDSSYRVTPYEDAHLGQSGIRQYWESVTANQRNVEFKHQPLSVTGNTGIAHWSAQFDIEPGDTHLELDGIFVLEFDEDGKCQQLSEWWHLKSQDAEGDN